MEKYDLYFIKDLGMKLPTTTSIKNTGIGKCSAKNAELSMKLK